MKQGLVSIITPMYNAEKYIKDTIESVLAQTYTEWEMIIVDDGSRDNSQCIAQEYEKREKRIRYVRKENGGVASARNYGIGIARGEYLAFLDSDDLWRVDKLEKQVKFMRETKCGFSYGACDVIDAMGNATGRIREVPEHLDYATYLHGNVVPCLTVMIDRKQVKNIEMPNMGHEDYATWLTIIRELGEARGINDVLGSYRKLGNSLSGNKLKAAKWAWNVYRKSQKLSVWKSMGYLYGHLKQAVKKR